jgi:hypothetical protein
VWGSKPEKGVSVGHRRRAERRPAALQAWRGHVARKAYARLQWARGVLARVLVPLVRARWAAEAEARVAAQRAAQRAADR